MPEGCAGIYYYPATTYLKSLSKNFGKRIIRTISLSDIEALKLHLILKPTRNKKQRTVAAIHRELEFLRTMLNFALANTWLDRSPFQSVGGKKLIHKSAEKDGSDFRFLVKSWRCSRLVKVEYVDFTIFKAGSEEIISISIKMKTTDRSSFIVSESAQQFGFLCLNIINIT